MEWKRGVRCKQIEQSYLTGYIKLLSHQYSYFFEVCASKSFPLINPTARGVLRPAT
jgi:hypothetical protein